MSRCLINAALLILLSITIGCSPGLYTRMDSTSSSFGKIYLGMTRAQAERNLNASVHLMQIDSRHYRVLYEYESERSTGDTIKYNMLDIATFGMGTLIVTPIDRFQGTSHLMAVDYEREGIYSADDQVIGINYEIGNNPNAMVWLDKGYLNTQKKEWDEVIRKSSIAITIDPSLSSSYINRAWAYSEIGEYDKAITDSDTALKLDPESALAYNNRGIALEGKGRINDARRDYKTACILDLEVACDNLDRLDE